jgi:hypothetical protein
MNTSGTQSLEAASRPASRQHHEHPAVMVPFDVIDIVANDIAQAHLSLNGLIALLRGHGQPDPLCLAHLLQYIEDNLERADEMISACLPSVHTS